ncbi:hypothetical protein JCM10908_004159 [Rhodotorula pacifica]|uniref:uncharacterized protein n=1 Tax=Rhodotorula pacifica TaxID=1495444 RepID=UPI003171CFDA
MASLSAMQRHASFPPAPDLPPGLSLDRLGCAAAEDLNDTSTYAFPGLGASASSPLVRTASESLLFGGSSSSASSSSSSNSSSTLAPPRGPPTVTRHASFGSGPELDWGLRRLSLEESADAADAKAKRERAAVREGWEDPALAAARRALWADDDTEAEKGPLAASGNGLVAGLADGTAKPRVDIDAEASAPAASSSTAPPPPITGSDADPTDADDASEDAAYSLLPPPACMPCHTTLSPRASCLRNSPLARSASLALSCSTSSFSSESSPKSYDSALPHTASSSRDRNPSRPRRNSSGRLSPSATSTASTSAPPSVSFSSAPPLEGATYSAIDYERGGDGPVEKLSVREWIELQGVREAVGVWSGKIGPWSAELEAALQNAADLGVGGNGTSKPSLSASTSSSSSSCTAPAALVGVVQVTKSAHNSPVLGATPLWR